MDTIEAVGGLVAHVKVGGDLTAVWSWNNNNNNTKKSWHGGGPQFDKQGVSMWYTPIYPNWLTYLPKSAGEKNIVADAIFNIFFDQEEKNIVTGWGLFI